MEVLWVMGRSDSVLGTTLKSTYKISLIVITITALGYLSNYSSVISLRSDIENQKSYYGDRGKHGGELNVKTHAMMPFIVEWWIREKTDTNEYEFYCGEYFMLFGKSLHTLRPMDKIDYSK